jgi:hypothetical protein
VWLLCNRVVTSDSHTELSQHAARRDLSSIRCEELRLAQPDRRVDTRYCRVRKHRSPRVFAQSSGSLLGLDCGVSLSRKSCELSAVEWLWYELPRTRGTNADLVSDFLQVDYVIIQKPPTRASDIRNVATMLPSPYYRN